MAVIVYRCLVSRGKSVPLIELWLVSKSLSVLMPN